MYCTITELNILYTLGEQYTSTQQSTAQQLSYDLVNSFLDSKLSISTNLSSTGGEYKVPGILKMAQAKFYQYILESTNLGYTDELQKMYDSTATMLSKITSNELTIPGVKIDNKNIGYNITSMYTTSSLGQVYIYPNQIPNYPVSYRIVITASGSIGEGTVKFNTYRGDNINTPFCTNVSATYDYTSILNSTSTKYDDLWLLWSGYWDIGDTIYIEGYPEFNINSVDISGTIEQGRISY